MKLWIAICGLGLLTVVAIYQTSAQTPERSASTAASSPAASTATAPADNREIIKVKTAEEFVKAIGPDRIIQLEPGEYNMTNFPGERDLTGLGIQRIKYARWTGDGEFIVRGVKNLRIEGIGDERARVVVRSAYYVFGLERSTNVELVNLEIGHLAKPRTCVNGVVKIVGCENVVMHNCDLYGCGTEGLNISRSAGFKFIRSIIRDCSEGIMSVDACEDMVFKDSRFSGNGAHYGFGFMGSDDVAFDNCMIENNNAGNTLFRCESRCSNVTIKGGSINGNTYSKLMDPENSVKTEKVDSADNKIVAGPGE